MDFFIYCSVLSTFRGGGKRSKKRPNPCLISLLLIIFASCRVEGKEEGPGQTRSGCIIRGIPTIAHDYVCLCTWVNQGCLKLVVILWLKLKSESAALEMSGESFLLFGFNLLFKKSSVLQKGAGKENTNNLSDLYRLVPYRSGDTGAAGKRLPGKSDEGGKHQLFQERTRPCTFPHVWASVLDCKLCDEER